MEAGREREMRRWQRREIILRELSSMGFQKESDVSLTREEEVELAELIRERGYWTCSFGRDQRTVTCPAWPGSPRESLLELETRLKHSVHGWDSMFVRPETWESPCSIIVQTSPDDSFEFEYRSPSFLSAQIDAAWGAGPDRLRSTVEGIAEEYNIKGQRPSGKQRHWLRGDAESHREQIEAIGERYFEIADRLAPCFRVWIAEVIGTRLLPTSEQTMANLLAEVHLLDVHQQVGHVARGLDSMYRALCRGKSFISIHNQITGDDFLLSPAPKAVKKAVLLALRYAIIELEPLLEKALMYERKRLACTLLAQGALSAIQGGSDVIYFDRLEHFTSNEAYEVFVIAYRLIMNCDCIPGARGRETKTAISEKIAKLAACSLKNVRDHAANNGWAHNDLRKGILEKAEFLPQEVLRKMLEK